MELRMKLIKSLPFILTPTLLLAACGGTTPTKPPVIVTAPTISATPANLTVTAGQQQTAALTITNTTSVTVSAAPTGLSATISGNNLVVINTAAAQGSYPLTLTATGPGGTAQTTVTVTVPAVAVPVTGDFSFKLDPSELNLTAGQSATVSTLLTPSGGFKGDVVYSVSGAPAGLNATVRGSTLNFTNASAVTGTSTLTVTATSGTLVHTTTLRVTTQAATPLPPGTPDFTLSVTPSSLSLAAGAQGTVALSTSALNNFNAALTYSVSGAPAGLSATISGTTLTVKNTSAPAGSYPLTLSATGGGVTHLTTVVVVVPSVATSTPDFALSLTPNALTLASGQSGTSNASISPTNGFTGNVSYTVSGAPAGLQAAFNGATLTVTNTSAAAGSYALTVTSTSGTLTHTTTLTVQVPGTNIPPTGDVTIALQFTPLILAENGSVNFKVYYANQNYEPDLSRPYTGALSLPNSSQLAAQGLIVTQENGQITIKDNGNTQPGNYFIEVKPLGASDSKILSRTVSFAISNSVSVVNPSGVALDSTGVSHAVYTFKGNNISFTEPEIKSLPYQGLNGTIAVDEKQVTQDAPRNQTRTLTLGFGFAAFDTAPLPINITVHFKDGSRATVPVTLQYQVSPHSPVKRFPAAIHARSAQEQAAITELNTIRASGTCGGKQYGVFPPVLTDVNLDNGNREYAAYNLSIGFYDNNRDSLRLYTLLNGYRDADYTMNILQLETTFNTAKGDDGPAFVHFLPCEDVMLDLSKNRVSIAYFPLAGNTGGYWSYLAEPINSEQYL